MESYAVNIKSYEEDVAKIYRKHVHCVDTALSQGWSLPKTKTCSGRGGDVTFTNKTCRSVMDNLEDFFELVFEYHPNSAEAKSGWQTMLRKYRIMMEHVLSRYDFTDEEIDGFQTAADSFY